MLFNYAAIDPTAASAHRQAVEAVKDATLSFRDAIRDLSAFRASPSQDPALVKALSDVESIELVLTKTAKSITDAESAGLPSDESDKRELKDIHMKLKILLQEHKASAPVRDDIGFKQITPGQYEIQAVKPSMR